MGKNFSNQLSSQIGESLVVAELGRRGIVATAFAGNVPDIDLLAYKNGKTLHLQVKSWRKGSVSTAATRFLDISIEDNRQTVRGLATDLDANLIFVFVKIGDLAGEDRFFILRNIELAEIIRRGYSSFLSRFDGVRPRNPKTLHTGVSSEDLVEYEANWPLIEDRFAAS